MVCTHTHVHDEVDGCAERYEKYTNLCGSRFFHFVPLSRFTSAPFAQFFFHFFFFENIILPDGYIAAIYIFERFSFFFFLPFVCIDSVESRYT